MTLTYKLVTVDVTDGTPLLWQCNETGAYTVDPIKNQDYDTTLAKQATQNTCPTCGATAVDMNFHLNWHAKNKI